MQAQRRNQDTDTPGPSKTDADTEVEGEEAAQGAWTLEDEEEDDATNVPVGDGGGSDDEVDPLDAFMAANETAAAAPAVKAEPAVKTEPADDPLDAFMTSEIAPAVNGGPPSSRVKLGMSWLRFRAKPRKTRREQLSLCCCLQSCRLMAYQFCMHLPDPVSHGVQEQAWLSSTC